MNPDSKFTIYPPILNPTNLNQSASQKVEQSLGSIDFNSTFQPMESLIDGDFKFPQTDQYSFLNNHTSQLLLNSDEAIPSHINSIQEDLTTSSIGQLEAVFMNFNNPQAVTSPTDHSILIPAGEDLTTPPFNQDIEPNEINDFMNQILIDSMTFDLDRLVENPCDW